MNRFVSTSLTWLALAGFYLFLAGGLGTVEVISMLVCATLGAALVVGLSLVALQHFVLRPPPRAILRPLAALLPEFWSVGRRLLGVAIRGSGRHVGDFRHQPFDFGTDASSDAGRRAVTLIGVSLAPGSFVIRGEPSAGTVLIHGLPPKPISPDTAWPA